MAKFKLGQRPKNFPKTVKFPMHDGSEGEIRVDYKYRTRTEYGAFVDAVYADKAAWEDGQPAGGGGDFTMAAEMDKSAERNVAYVLQIADGWSLDEPFGADALRQLADEMPSAVLAIITEYRLAVTEGRLGN